MSFQCLESFQKEGFWTSQNDMRSVRLLEKQKVDLVKKFTETFSHQRKTRGLLPVQFDNNIIFCKNIYYD
jgi:hypothetical protein